MKNRVSTILTIVVLYTLPLPGAGQSSSPPPASVLSKAGVINVQEAIASTAEGRKAFADIQKKYQPKQQDLQRQQQEIQALTDQLQRQANTLSEEEKINLNRELQEKQKLFKRASEDAQADFTEDNQASFQRIFKKMAPFIDDYAKENGFTLVVDESQLPVVYVAKEIDITEDIVKRFDAANPVEGAPAAAQPTKPPVSNPPAAKPITPRSPVSKPPAKPPAK